MPVAKLYQLLVIVTFAFLAAACGAAGVGAGGPDTGKPAGGAAKKPAAGGGEVADFVLKDVDGRSHALSDYLAVDPL